MSEMIDFKLPKQNESLTRAGQWVESFLNSLGGDYVTDDIGVSFIVLTNKVKCPNFCIDNCSATTCDEMERIISKAITIFNPNLEAQFTLCAKEKSGGCALTILME